MNNRFIQGYYTPRNPAKYVGKSPVLYRSSFERIAFVFLDNHPLITRWGSESVAIQYKDPTTNNKARRYIVDLIIIIQIPGKPIKKYLCEIKPYSQTIKPVKSKRAMSDKQARNYINSCMTYAKNVAKWKAAQEWVKHYGMEFLILTEYELGIKKGPKPARN